MWPGRERKATDAVRTVQQTGGSEGDARRARPTPPGRPEESGGLVLGLASSRWGRTGPRRPAAPTRTEPRGVFRAEAGPGRWEAGGKWEGDLDAGRSQRGVARRPGPAWAAWARSCVR